MLNPVANLEFWANLKPDALAYADDEIQITFSELNLFVRKIAAFLFNQGVKKGNIVGTNLPSYLSFVFGYAIQSIGATLVPGVSPEKIRGIITLDFLVSMKEFEDIEHIKSIIIDENIFTEINLLKPAKELFGFLNDSDISIVLSTSGTTGDAKFLPLTVIQLWAASTRPGTNDSFGSFEVLNLLPFGSAWSTFHALKCLFLGKPYFGFTYRDKRLLKVISNYPIRTIIGSPVQIKTLVDAITELKISLPNVESILIGGSSPSKALFREIKSKINCKVFNTYGSTEAGHIAINEIDGEEDIGLLIRPPVNLQIVDSNNLEVPSGEAGSIRYKVPNMPNHFLSDPIATSNSFKDGYFYPGDLGLINEKGRLVLAGRRDELLNLGGVKANPESLEEIALTIEGVLEAAAFSIQNATTEELSFALVTNGGFELGN